MANESAATPTSSPVATVLRRFPGLQVATEEGTQGLRKSLRRRRRLPRASPALSQASRLRPSRVQHRHPASLAAQRQREPVRVLHGHPLEHRSLPRWERLRSAVPFIDRLFRLSPQPCPSPCRHDRRCASIHVSIHILTVDAVDRAVRTRRIVASSLWPEAAPLESDRPTPCQYICQYIVNAIDLDSFLEGQKDRCRRRTGLA